MGGPLPPTSELDNGLRSRHVPPYRAVLNKSSGDPYEARHAGPLEHMADRMRALRTAVAALPEEDLVTATADEY